MAKCFEERNFLSPKHEKIITIEQAGQEHEII